MGPRNFKDLREIESPFFRIWCGFAHSVSPLDIHRFIHKCPFPTKGIPSDGGYAFCFTSVSEKICNEARRYERNADRASARAGHYTRSLQTTSGEVTLKVPKLRNLPFETTIIERYRRRESSVEEALVEMYLAGVSVRRVEDITEELWGSRVSSSTISELNQKIYKTLRLGEAALWRQYTLICLSMGYGSKGIQEDTKARRRESLHNPLCSLPFGSVRSEAPNARSPEAKPLAGCYACR